MRWSKCLTMVAIVFMASVAIADDPKFGGCTKDQKTCFGPSVSVNVLAVSLKTGDLTTTFDPGVGYGVTLFSDRWYKTGFSVTVAFPQIDASKRVMPAAIFSFAEFARFGFACPLWTSGGLPDNGQILFAFGSDFGSSK